MIQQKKERLQRLLDRLLHQMNSHRGKDPHEKVHYGNLILSRQTAIFKLDARIKEARAGLARV